MNRRCFLRDVIAAGAAFALVPGLLRAEVAQRTDSERFALARAKQPWLTGWKSVDNASLGPTTAAIEGRLPKGFAGTLYRDGPAWFERAGFRYRHWFDGDGMLHAWQFGERTVEHRARMIATSKFTREQAAGRFLLPAAGTTIPGAVPIRNNDDVNTANTAVIRFDGRLFALWEGGSAYELDAASLHTLGPVSWRDDLVAAPFSAHPLIERDGSLWNFGSLDLLSGSGLLLWHVGVDGKLLRSATVATPAPGYLHSFAMTRRHLVFVLMPYQLEQGQGAAFFERLRFHSTQPCRIAVVPKDALDAPRWFEVEFGAVYHYADACERNGEIVVSAARHDDPAEMRAPMAAAMRGAPGSSIGTELVALHLNLANGRARWQASGVRDIEFPAFDHRHDAAAPARLFAPMRIEPAAAPYFNAIAAIDPVRGRHSVHRYGGGVLVEEHVFVPKPASRRVGEGWLVGTLLDAPRGRSGVAVLDAEHVEDGPLAQAWLPYAMPLGFHGTFAA
ncbi:MAG: carotenoid oxygenase family protein [Dokdonella sp.]